MEKMSSEIISILLGLLNVKGIGFVKANKIVLNLKDKGLLDFEFRKAVLSSLNNEQVEEFENSDSSFLSKKSEVSYISVLEKSYPKELWHDLGMSCPTVLPVMGNFELLKKRKIGFSGSRNVSEKGIYIAQDIASQLTESDFCLVSGYANGVDLATHKTALQYGGSTIMVLPEGIDGFRIKNELKPYWDWNRVLVMSEFSPAAKWSVSRAMQRNRTIIALSKAMMVIEAGEKGGSLDAGLKTIDNGKQLFVPQYADFPVSALGNVQLIKNGAFPLKMKRSNNRANLDGFFHLVSQTQPSMTLFG